MSRMVIDEVTRQKLGAIEHPTLLYDAQGNMVGMLMPPKYVSIQPVLSDGEIERRVKSEKVYTTAEVIKHLESLS